MSTASSETITGARIDTVDVSPYQIPTATDPESDGTLEWDSTSVVVVELSCGGATGLGYTYCHPAAAQIIAAKLSELTTGSDPLTPQQTWARMQVRTRQLGHDGIAAMAVSAVDVALWDLKAQLLGVCLAEDAVQHAERYGELGVTYFEEPVSSDDLRGLADVRTRAPAGMAVAAGEYGWNLPYFQRMLDAEAVPILQADVTRCVGITNLRTAHARDWG